MKRRQFLAAAADGVAGTALLVPPKTEPAKNSQIGWMRHTVVSITSYGCVFYRNGVDGDFAVVPVSDSDMRIPISGLTNRKE